MDKTTTEAFGKPRLRNATQSSGQRANETVARPGGLTPKAPSPATTTEVNSIPGRTAHPGAGDGAKGRSVGEIPKAARPGGSTPSKGK